MIPRTLILVACAAGSAVMAAAAPAEFPRRGVTIVVPFPAGGTADAIPRIVGAKLAERWGHPVIIENRPGAAGTTGSTSVANASPDGHTLLASPAGPKENDFCTKRLITSAHHGHGRCSDGTR